jgi:SAM-dependent methyltransferase
MLGEGEMLDLITTWLPPNGRVIDVGCGSGRLLTALAERGISGIGIDPYASNAERCRHLRAEEMDQLAERFDLVYTRYTLHHLDAPQRFPERARSVLRPSGVLLIVDWVEGARTGVPERYSAPQTVAGWVRKAGFRLLCEDVRGQSMVIVGRLPTARPEPKTRRNGGAAMLPFDPIAPVPRPGTKATRLTGAMVDPSGHS